MGDRYLLVSLKGFGNELDEGSSWISVTRTYSIRKFKYKYFASNKAGCIRQILVSRTDICSKN